MKQTAFGKKPGIAKLCLLFILLPLLGSCVFLNFSGINTIRGQGELESFSYPLGSFNRVRVDGFIAIHYHPGASGPVILEIQANLEEYVSVQVVDNELVVTMNRNIQGGSTLRPRLHISSPSLEAIHLNGAWEFTAHDPLRTGALSLTLNGVGAGTMELEVQTLHLNMGGVSNLVLQGRTDTMELSISGVSNLEARDLVAREGDVHLGGVGSAAIHVAETLRLNARGTGSIEYRGSPQLDLNTSGTMNIRRIP